MASSPLRAASGQLGVPVFPLATTWRPQSALLARVPSHPSPALGPLNARDCLGRTSSPLTRPAPRTPSVPPLCPAVSVASGPSPAATSLTPPRSREGIPAGLRLSLPPAFPDLRRGRARPVRPVSPGSVLPVQVPVTLCHDDLCHDGLGTDLCLPFHGGPGRARAHLHVHQDVLSAWRRAARQSGYRVQNKELDSGAGRGRADASRKGGQGGDCRWENWGEGHREAWVTEMTGQMTGENPEGVVQTGYT